MPRWGAPDQAHAEDMPMWIEATAEASSFVKERGGMLFVWARRFGSFPGGLTMLETTTEPPPDALEWRRIEMKGFLLFVPRKMRLPDELRLQVRGRFRRRIDALWNGCIYVV